MLISIDQKVPAYDSYAAERTRGLYNVEAEDGRRFTLNLDVPVDQNDWQIGVIAGPSGSGKSSAVRQLSIGYQFQEWHGQGWPEDAPIIEALGQGDYGKASAALAAVGLGSVPSWLRPHHVLSAGEQFRANMAQLLLSDRKNVVLDEFTSVLDRRVAQVAAGAFAKSWRRQTGRRVILATCHYDVLDWVQPDWWIDTAEGLDQFAEERGVLVARKGRFLPDRRSNSISWKQVGDLGNLSSSVTITSWTPGQWVSQPRLLDLLEVAPSASLVFPGWLLGPVSEKQECVAW